MSVPYLDGATIDFVDTSRSRASPSTPQRDRLLRLRRLVPLSPPHPAVAARLPIHSSTSTASAVGEASLQGRARHVPPAAPSAGAARAPRASLGWRLPAQPGLRPAPFSARTPPSSTCPSGPPTGSGCSRCSRSAPSRSTVRCPCPDPPRWCWPTRARLGAVQRPQWRWSSTPPEAVAGLATAHDEHVVVRWTPRTLSSRLRCGARGLHAGSCGAGPCGACCRRAGLRALREPPRAGAQLGRTRNVATRADRAGPPGAGWHLRAV